MSEHIRVLGCACWITMFAFCSQAVELPRIGVGPSLVVGDLSVNANARIDRQVEAGGTLVRLVLVDTNAALKPWPVTGRHQGRVVYDLEQWNDVFWERFTRIVNYCRKRNCAIAIQLWMGDEFVPPAWEHHPWNPLNNWNFGPENLPVDRGWPAVATAALGRSNSLGVFNIQRRFIDKTIAELGDAEAYLVFGSAGDIANEIPERWAAPAGGRINTHSVYAPSTLDGAIRLLSSVNLEAIDIGSALSFQSSTDLLNACRTLIAQKPVEAAPMFVAMNVPVESHPRWIWPLLLSGCQAIWVESENPPEWFSKTMKIARKYWSSTHVLTSTVLYNRLISMKSNEGSELIFIPMDQPIDTIQFQPSVNVEWYAITDHGLVESVRQTAPDIAKPRTDCDYLLWVTP